MRRLLGRAGANARFRIFRKTYGAGEVRCYGAAMLDTEAQARDLVSHLNGRQCQGRSLEARLFVHRNPSNDRRAPPWQGQHWPGVDRRKTERRSSW